MAKGSKTVYACRECGRQTREWAGKCPQCGRFSTMEETVLEEAGNERSRAGLKSAGSVKPTKRARGVDELSHNPVKRNPTGIKELDRVLGGGFVEAEVVLFAGQPGAGKSTLSLAIADRFAAQGKKVLYSSGEESEHQIGLRAKRMKVANPLIRVVNETNLETLMGHIDEEKPDLLIVDSLQTLASSEISGSAGSISQSKEAAHALTRRAKADTITMVLINQVIKSGDFSGSEAIQHIVDCAMIFESDQDSPLKFLRTTKNRFGDTNEVGIFQHVETGLEEVSDPSGILLDEDSEESISGAACSFISEGIRQVPVEIQALVTPSTLANPRKQFSGINFQRGQIVCAILDKFCNGRFFETDTFISTVSGIRVNDPQADLAIAAALLSSKLGKGIPPEVAFVGELSLTGQVRGAFMLEGKIKEAQRLGFKTILVPASSLRKMSKKPEGIKVVGISSIKDLAKHI